MLEPRQHADRRNFLKSALRFSSVLLVLIAVLTVQSAIVADQHDLQGDRGHSCAVCHAGHSTALPALSAIPIAVPTLVVWRGVSEKQQLAGEPYAEFDSSRAPPSSS